MVEAHQELERLELGATEEILKQSVAAKGLDDHR